MNFKDNPLLLVATVATFGLLYSLLFVQIPDKNVQVFVFLAGTICGFFFGSSVSKQRPGATNESVDISTPDGLQKAVKKYFNP